MRGLLAFLAALLLGAPAWAQSSPNVFNGQIPTAAQWNSYFSAKMDALGGIATNPTLNGTIGTQITGSGSQCIHASSAGILSGTGADCGSGGGGGSPGGPSGSLQFNLSGALGGVPGLIFDGTSTVTLGQSGISAGGLKFNNATSGNVTLMPATGALGAIAITIPATAGIMTVLGNSTTGTGPFVLGTSPTLVNPALGTIASGVGTNLTGIPLGGLVNVGSNVILGNGLNTTGAVAQIPMPNCNAAGDALQYTSNSLSPISCSLVGGSITVTDGVTTVANATNLTVGNGFVISGTTPNAVLNSTFPSITKTTSYTVASTDMANGLSLQATSGSPVLTLPTASSTVFGPGMTTNFTVAGTTNWTLTNSTGLTAVGLPATLVPGMSGTLAANSNGSEIDYWPSGIGLTTTGTSGAATLSGGVVNIPQYQQALTLTTTGSSGAATLSAGALNIPVYTGGGSSVVQPQGRLTCTTGVPVPIADVAACTTIYYDSFKGANQVSVYNGTSDVNLTITAGEISDALPASSTGVVNSADVFDEWGVNVSAALVVCHATNGSGGGWASDTAGSITARGTGYTQLDKTTRAYITNANAITHCYHGATDEGSIAANRATYLGTFYTTAAGTTQMLLNPAGTSGGNNNCVCLFNAYNQVTFRSLNVDNASNWTAVGTSAEPMHNSTSNAIRTVDGLGQSSVTTAMDMGLAASSMSVFFGTVRDSTSTLVTYTVISNNGNSGEVTNVYQPSIGFHYYQAIEEATATTAGALGVPGRMILTVTQ